MDKLFEIYMYITVALIGLVVGSFLNVIIYRLPKGTVFKEKRSYCPHCNTPLKWYELIPIISYIFLRGRCRTCKERISIRYPFVELLNAVLWIMAYHSFGLSYYTLILIIFFSALVTMSMIDLDTKEIPNGFIILFMLLGIASFFAYPEILWWERLLGLVVMSVPFLIIAMLTGGIGGGDIKLLFAAGLILGWKLIILGGIIGVFVGGISGALLLILKRAGRKYEMPFGPSLAVGFVIALLYGNIILDWYLGFMS